MRKGMKLYFIIIALTALGLALTNDVFSNYFKDAYQVTPIQRGLLEIPREAPGVILVLVVTGLSFMSDIRISMISRVLSLLGITMLGLSTPSFSVMMVFVFINSMGMHLFFPMQDSIGMSLAEPDQVGRRMGQYKGLFTGFQMVGAGLVFVGFRSGFFSFTSDIKWIFILAALIMASALVLFVYLDRAMHIEGGHPKKSGFVIRKEYKYYYVLVIMFGIQKQMMMVYGPWVLIDILDKKADTIAALGIVGLFIGIFFIPSIGRWVDRFGVGKMLYADAISFILVYLLYGLLCAGYVSGVLATAGTPVLMAYALFIIDKMSGQMGIVRTLYLRSIALKPEDITSSLSLGISMDHVMSITFAVIGGFVWKKYGPQYIFFMVAFLSLANLYVAVRLNQRTQQ